MGRRSVGCLTLALLALGSPPAPGASTSPVAWSPDGEWVAYVVATPEKPEPLDTSWIFRGRDDEAKDQSPAALTRPAQRHRLWASRVGSGPDGPSTLIDDSPGPITAPTWRHDGKSLAFGRIVAPPDSKGRFEVVRLDAAGRRVLHSQPVDDPSTDGPALAGSPLVWSPDGRYLVAPRARPSGLIVLRAENGAVVRSIEGATRAAWAPQGNRLYYLVTTAAGRSEIGSIDGPLGPARRLEEVGRVASGLLPGRDGQSVLVLSRTRILLEDGTQPERIELMRLRLDDGRRERVMPATVGPIVTGGVDVAAALTQDRDGDSLFAAIALPGEPYQVEWLRPRERVVLKKFPVLDPSVAPSDLSLSPDGKTLSLRLGPPNPSSPAVLCDLESMVLTPLAPDGPARGAWITLALATVRSILREGLPTAIHGGRTIDRAVAFPLAGELESNSEILARLRRVARTARPLLDPEPGDLAREEARFLLDQLREDFPAALSDLDRLAELEPTPDRRLAVVGLRGGVFAALGDLDRARDAFRYIKSVESSRTRRTIEETRLGPVVSEPSSPDAGWADYALARVDLLAHDAEEERQNDRLFREPFLNPDAPVPGLGLDLEPVPRPALPEPPPPPGLPLRRNVIPVPR